LIFYDEVADGGVLRESGNRGNGKEEGRVRKGKRVGV